MQASNPDLKFWLAIMRVPNFGAIKISKLFRAFPSMERAFFASKEELVMAGLDLPSIHLFLEERKNILPEREEEKLHKEQTTLITLADSNYPSRLKQIFDPPACFFLKGALPDEQLTHLAVVGTRHPSHYGMRSTQSLVTSLAQSNVVIVSGLAYGVDTIAHKTTLEQNGKTIAVLGCGIDDASIYPSGNKKLAQQITDSCGAVMSEFPFGTLPLKHHFPLRNRIIAGLSHGTIVIEAAQKSGSLITAKSALENGRDVYALPGPIDSLLSEGPNNLIKMGATLITSVSDIIDAPTISKPTFSYVPQTAQEELLLLHIQDHPIHIDELILLTNLPIDVTNSTLTLLEMKGVIHHEGGRYYSRHA